MVLSEFPFSTIHSLRFQARSRPLPVALRPIFIITVIALILKINCKDSSASLIKLYFFNWCLKNETVRGLAEKYCTAQNVFLLDVVHVDPLINIGLKYALAENIIEITKTSRYKLTKKGQTYIDNIIIDNSLFLKERSLLSKIGNTITEVKLKGNYK